MTSALHEERLDAVMEAVRASGARSVLDLGCGDGDLVTRLAVLPGIERITGLDASRAALERLAARLAALEERVAARVDLVHGSLLEAGAALGRFDCATLVEVIEHLAPERLALLERAAFRRLRPRTVVITTPNADFNPLLGVPAHRRRRPDHRFEWGRARFRRWAEEVARRQGYAVAHADLAGAHPALGGASQMAVFRAPPVRPAPAPRGRDA